MLRFVVVSAISTELSSQDEHDLAKPTCLQCHCNTLSGMTRDCRGAAFSSTIFLSEKLFKKNIPRGEEKKNIQKWDVRQTGL